MKILHLLACLILNVSLSGCITSSTLATSSRPTTWGMQINQANNFYQISNHIYRSEQPNTTLITDLQKHNIQVVINLRTRNEDAKVLKNQNLTLVQIPINTWSMNREDILKVMQVIQKAQEKDQNVLIHCYHGSDRTGASIAMYRIIFENWTTKEALREMKYGGYGFHPIWVNIEKIFSPENIKWIRQQLSNPS